MPEFDVIPDMVFVTRLSKVRFYLENYGRLPC